MICTAEALERRLSQELGRERRGHSRRVADLAAELCVAHGLDPEKGTLAGLAHDWARETPPDRLRELALRDGRGESKLEAQYPVLLHGRAAAVSLIEELGMADPEILEAVACHVTGCPGMGLLARIVFVADFLEPGRGFLPEEVRRGMLKLNLEDMMIAVLEEIFAYLHSSRRPIARPAVQLLEELRRS
jgi:nicotinate-nucleotide adenylyltransferase